MAASVVTAAVMATATMAAAALIGYGYIPHWKRCEAHHARRENKSGENRRRMAFDDSHFERSTVCMIAGLHVVSLGPHTTNDSRTGLVRETGRMTDT